MHASRKFCLFLFVASLQQAADPKQAQLLARPSLGPAAASSHRTTPQLIMCERADHKGALKLSSFPPVLEGTSPHTHVAHLRMLRLLFHRLTACTFSLLAEMIDPCASTAFVIQ